jgi:hypothetical protein
MKMTTATIEKQETAVEYQEFTWQAIEKMADAIGVRYYKDKDRYRWNGGRGFTRARHDKTLIKFAGGIDVYGDNQYTKETALRYHKEAFFLRIELYCLKNNLKYVLVEETHSIVRTQTVYAGMRIIK